ncbi:MAG: hypothetical protein LWX09_07930 [Bacteroidia bacterium]|jgi:hypothetical protein|nr:hypothetical protein [Bacteroidia bacterium]
MQRLSLTALVALAIFVMLPHAGSLMLAVKLFDAQMQAGHKLSKGIDNEELIVLDIPKDLEKSNNGRFIRIHAGEFIWESEMYDIVSTQDLGTVTRYVVYPDRKETKLKRKIERKMAENGRKPLSKCIEQLYAFHWICQTKVEKSSVDTGQNVVFLDKIVHTHGSYCTQSCKPPELKTGFNQG